MHDRLLALFTGLRPRSIISLKQALDIRDQEGVSATLIIQIPAKAGERPEVFLTTAPTQLVTDLSRPL